MDVCGKHTDPPSSSLGRRHSLKKQWLFSKVAGRLQGTAHQESIAQWKRLGRMMKRSQTANAVNLFLPEIKEEM
jgi:hypothetical protein